MLLIVAAASASTSAAASASAATAKAESYLRAKRRQGCAQQDVVCVFVCCYYESARSC